MSELQVTNLVARALLARRKQLEDEMSTNALVGAVYPASGALPVSRDEAKRELDHLLAVHREL